MPLVLTSGAVNDGAGIGGRPCKVSQRRKISQVMSERKVQRPSPTRRLFCSCSEALHPCRNQSPLRRQLTCTIRVGKGNTSKGRDGISITRLDRIN